MDADVVVGVPDSGLDAALGYAQESGIPYGMGFIKNKYIGRTFISPGQDQRIAQVRIISLLRDAGAKEVHMRVSAPPFLNPCYYGTDIDSRDHLIACHRTIPEIADIIGADSLGYLPTGDLCRLIGDSHFCSACFDGNYPTTVPESTQKDRFERPLSARNKGQN